MCNVHAHERDDGLKAILRLEVKDRVLFTVRALVMNTVTSTKKVFEEYWL